MHLSFRGNKRPLKQDVGSCQSVAALSRTEEDIFYQRICKSERLRLWLRLLIPPQSCMSSRLSLSCNIIGQQNPIVDFMTCLKIHAQAGTPGGGGSVGGSPIACMTC
jgi:hypothetical protein